MALLKFLKGNYSSLSTKAITEGQVLICGDTGEMFVDVAADKRVKIGDFVVVSTVEALEALDAKVVPTSRLYYVEDGNILARSNGTGWVQINKQKTLAELGGVAKSAYDTKMAALEKADRDNATAISNLSTLVGTIPEGAGADTVIAYINKKTDGIATSGNLEALARRVTASESDIDNLQAAIGVGGSVTLAIADAKKAGTDAQAAADDAKAIANSKTTMAEVEAKNYATKTEAQGYADAKDSAIATAKKAGDDAQADVDVLETKVGTVPENKTVVQMIAEAQAAATYDDTALKGRVSNIEKDYLKAADKTELQGNIDTVSDKVTTLIGSVEGDDGKSARTIASEEVAKIVAGADASYDTLKEVSDWISSHKKDASAMNSAIIALEGIVDGIGGDGEKATVVAYVTDAIAALNIGDYAKAADLTALASRVTTAEGKITILEGQVATINGDATTAGSIAKAAADALASAKAYTDEKDTAMDTRVDALEAASHTHRNKALLDTYTQTEENLADAVAKKHEHTNKTVLDGITAEKVSAWNSAESNAKSYTDELANGQVTTNKTNIESLQSGKANKATTLAGYGIGDAYTKDEVQELLTWGEF